MFSLSSHQTWDPGFTSIAPVAKGLPRTDWLGPGVQEPVTCQSRPQPRSWRLGQSSPNPTAAVALGKGGAAAAESTPSQDLTSMGLERLSTPNPMGAWGAGGVFLL